MDIPPTPDLTRFTDFQIVQIDIDSDDPLFSLNQRIGNGYRLIATWVTETPADYGGHKQLLNGLVGLE